MQQLIRFLYRVRVFLFFIFLETVSISFWIQNDFFAHSNFFNSSNSIVARLLSITQNLKEYFVLNDINDELTKENATMRTLLDRINSNRSDSLSILKQDSIGQFQYISAKIYNNSVSQSRNHVTINKGEEEGVKAGMAVVSPLGAIGKVEVVSKHFSVVASLLNIDQDISCVLKRTGNFGTVSWDGRDSRFVDLMYIPFHVKPLIGDSVVTSGFNAVFPENILIGVIRDYKFSNGALFYDINVELAQDFTKLSYVYVVISRYKQEIDSLRVLSNEF